jgi:hypothetical protein
MFGHSYIRWFSESVSVPLTWQWNESVVDGFVSTNERFIFKVTGLLAAFIGMQFMGSGLFADWTFH